MAPDYPGSASDFEVISLKDGDRVVGAVQLASEDLDLVFITSDAQLLRFGADAVRPQGRAAGGMAGIRLSARASVVWFGAVDPADSTAEVVTVAGRTGALPGTTAATVKVSAYTEYPPKGRATGGVRCHRFLKGEDALVLAWAGAGPAHGATDAGRPVELPPPDRPPRRLRRAHHPAPSRHSPQPHPPDRAHAMITVDFAPPAAEIHRDHGFPSPQCDFCGNRGRGEEAGSVGGGGCEDS